MKFSIHAPAKINWFLWIKGKRPDGYHDIVSPMQCVSLFDVLSFEDAPEIELVSDLDLPAGENLVYKAAVLLKQNASYGAGARIVLEKNIPLAAGLGGGSSDAAQTLIGLNKLWGLGLGEEELMAYGARIGSDVPFFMRGPFSVVEGRGEIVNRLKTEISVAMLLVKPDVAIPASWAYGKYVAELTKKSVDIKLFCLALERKDFASLRQMVFNDLEKGVVEKYRIVAEIKEMLLDNGAEIASMSGSGSVVFGVFHSEEEARRASGLMGDYWCRVVRTLV
jgi:4-diphosphocytidyl-2-C-methyl-D-erythritol kinase